VLLYLRKQSDILNLRSQLLHPMEPEPQESQEIVDLTGGSSVHPLVKPSKTTSWVWTHFRKYPESSKAHIAICLLCLEEGRAKNQNAKYSDFEVLIGGSYSTSKLTQHLFATHRAVYDANTQKEASSSLNASLNFFLIFIKFSFMKTWTF
jgi:predicted Zn-dependent peptidase